MFGPHSLGHVWPLLQLLTKNPARNEQRGTTSSSSYAMLWGLSPCWYRIGWVLISRPELRGLEGTSDCDPGHDFCCFIPSLPGRSQKMCVSGRHVLFYYPLVNRQNYGTSPFLMGKSTISMAIFNSYVCLPEDKCNRLIGFQVGNVCMESSHVVEQIKLYDGSCISALLIFHETRQNALLRLILKQ